MTFSIRRAPALSAEVARSLSDAIRSGALAPGDRLPSEKELAERYAVSRMVVREALSRLKSDALVESRQGLGAFVAAEPGKGLFRLEADASTRASLRHVFQLRVAVEGAAAGLAAVQASDAHRAAVARALDDLRADIAAGRDGIEADNSFHEAIARASGNPYFERFLSFLGASLREVIAHARVNTRARHPGRIMAVQAEHEAVLAAITAADAPGAEAAMRTHLSNAMERLGFGPFASETAP